MTALFRCLYLTLLEVLKELHAAFNRLYIHILYIKGSEQLHVAVLLLSNQISSNIFSLSIFFLWM